MINIIFSSLAINQSNFWMKLSPYFGENFNIKILCFDSESTKKINSSFIEDATFYKKQKVDFKIIKKYLKKYGIKNIKKILFHEINYYKKRNNFKLLSEFVSTLIYLESFFEKIDKNSTVVQELGGFIPNLAIFYITRKKKINHFFLEPSFYKNRYHASKNTFSDFTLKKKYETIEFEELIEIINQIKIKRNPVIPIKDKLHFRNPIKKLFYFKNIYRFFYKLITQNALNYTYVFNQNIRVVLINILEIFNYFKNKNIYTDKVPSNYIYYPMHVPNDVALTIRAQEQFDQINLIKKLCKTFENELICIKEHPARIGSLNLDGLRGIKNLKIINPKINNFDVINKCKVIFAINSKAGFEALIMNKKVISLSESFYSRLGKIYYLNKQKNVENNLNEILELNSNKKQDNIFFFKKVYENSLEGELYLDNRKNLALFCDSIKKIILHG